MDGLTVLKEIRAIDPHAPVIILGGGATEIQENQARALRVTDFVRKGLSLDVLVEGVNRVVQQPARKPEAAGGHGRSCRGYRRHRSWSWTMNSWCAICSSSF